MLRDRVCRRRFIQYCLAASVATVRGVRGAAAEIPPHPDPKKFQSGDFLWPARPGAFIPFNNTRSLRPNAEDSSWEEEKRRFIEEARRSDNPALRAIADDMETLSYEEFEARYFNNSGGANTRSLAPFGTGSFEVGHVAVIEIDAGGTAWVVEAMPKSQQRYEALFSRFKNGVIRTKYTNWIAQHEGYNVWHGRLKGVAASGRSVIVREAKAFLGRDYWFWSFDLADETGFYCSKLVWVSVWKALGIPLDGDKTFLRNFWVTPKTLINSKLVDLLHNPGTYGR